jgi:membrane protein
MTGRLIKYTSNSEVRGKARTNRINPFFMLSIYFNWLACSLSIYVFRCGAPALMKTLRLTNLWRLLEDSGIAWKEDNMAQHGAALTFFTVFSLSPLVVLIIALSSFGFGRGTTSGHLLIQVQRLIGTEAAQFVQGVLTTANESGSNIPATIFSVATLLLGTSAVYVQLRDSLNTIWHVKPKPEGTLRGFLRARLVSIIMILGIGILLMASLILTTVLSAMSKYVGGSFAFLAGWVTVFDFVVSFLGATVLFAFMFKFIPALTLKWKDVLVGAGATSLLFSAGKLVIGLYLGNGAMGSIFGVASSLVIIMTWTFYSSQIVLFGAEFTRVYSMRIGRTKGRS